MFIPDKVYAEATRDMAKLGAEEVVTWVRAHLGQVQLVPTQVFAEFQALQSLNPHIRSKGRGEQAALELLQYQISSDPDLQAMLFIRGHG